MAREETDQSARNLGLGLVLLTVSILFALLGFEGTLRLYHLVKQIREERSLPPVEERALIPSEDPELFFQFNPGWRNEEFSVNAHGMPDVERTLEKPTGVFRIAFVGDSLTANFGLVAREEAFPTVVEEILSQGPGGGFETLNFGVQGYSILQSLRMAQTRVREFAPDVLVAQLCLNDPYPSDTPYARVSRGIGVRGVAFLWRRLQPARFWAYSFVERNYDEQGWENVRQGLNGFAQLAEEGLPTLAVLFPYLYRPAYESWDFAELHARWREEARRAGLPLLDLRRTFEEAGLIVDTWPQDPIHPDPAGHRLAARAIVSELRGRGWLPAEGRRRARR